MAERGRPRHPDILTPRQSEVLELVREGLTNPQIAERLGISPDGAKWHVKEILWKLEVPSREEAARWQREREASAHTARASSTAAPGCGRTPRSTRPASSFQLGHSRASGRCRFLRLTSEPIPT